MNAHMAPTARRIVVVLASPRAGYITGQVVVVDGGLVRWR